MTLDDQAAGELTEAVDERLARLRELATLRVQARRAQRERLNRRRTYGLAKRHKTKLDRGRTDQ